MTHPSVYIINERGRRLAAAKRIVTTYGLSVEGEGLYADELEVCTPETCFVIEDDDRTHVIMWTGSYPFAQDHPQGCFDSVEEAARHAVWLLKREAFYYQREEENLERLPCYRGTPGCQHKDIEHDECEGY